LWLVAGLGNPGTRYARTRHNAGFFVLDEIARSRGLEFSEKAEYKICSGSIGGEKTLLLEPLTFMNRSGNAAGKIARKFAVPPEKIIVVHDDLDLQTGSLKIRKKGSSGGHKGVESVIQTLGADNFIRVKVGIGRDPFTPVEQYVLSKFRRDEIPLIKEAVGRAVQAIDCIIAEGVDKAMNKFN
jgi:peptidyl-tRNA hydrolase, PTH1 family